MGLAADLVFPPELASAIAVPLSKPRHIRYRTVHNFDTTEGSVPYAGLLLASDGNAYGTTSAGGAHFQNNGTLYQLDRAKSVKLLHSCTEPTGYQPRSGLVEADDGALYGVTTLGGATNAGVAFRFSREAGYVVLHEFGIFPAEGQAPSGILFASDGQFYGGMSGGGHYDDGVLYRMDKMGNVTPLWQLGSGADPAVPVGAPIEAPDGLLYGTTLFGGAHDLGTVYSMAKDGSNRQIIHSFKGVGALAPMAPLTLATDGWFYSVAGGGSRDFGTIYRVRSDGKFEVLYDFTGGEDGGAPNAAPLEIESGVFVGTASYGGDVGGGVAYMIRPDGRYRRLHDFGGTVHGAADGIWPYGNLALVEPGHVLGTCSQGGTGRRGTVWSLQVVPA
jgi:uncharacterized repeat protein (TIGR03803 family)